MLNLKCAKKGIIISIIAILILTALEFPPPVGFETRPQNNVSLFWLAFFLVILIVEISATLLIFKRQKLGAGFGLIAAGLNILQVIADQAHLMQPEAATLAYSLLEGAVVIFSLALAYFSWNVYNQNNV